jgi:hypothetical protein
MVFRPGVDMAEKAHRKKATAPPGICGQSPSAGIGKYSLERAGAFRSETDIKQ